MPIDVRKGQGDVQLSRDEFERRVRQRFYDPAAAAGATIDRYVGYYEPSATSHAALDRDTAFQDEARNAARALVEAVRLSRAGQLPRPDRDLHPPRPK